MRLLHPHGPDPDADVDRDGLVELYAHPGNGTWTRLNFVASADGSVQGTDGRSGSLSTPADREVFALLRSLSDVILVGAGTARAECHRPVRPHEVDVALRRQLRLGPVPPLAVVSGRLDLPDHLLDADEGAPRTIVVTTAAAPADRRDRIAERAEVVVAGDGARVLHGDAMVPGLELDLGHVLADGSDLFLRWTTADQSTTERS